MEKAKADEHNPALWYTVLIIGVIAASASGAIIKVAQKEGAPPLVIATIRNYVACIVLLPFFLSGSWRELRLLTRREVFFVIGCGLVLAFHFAMWIMSLEKTSVASATIFITTTPIFVVLGSHYLLHEKVSPAIFIGIGVSLAGGVLVVGADFGYFFGDLLALIGAIAASAYMLIGRRVRPKLHLVPYIFVVYGTAAVSLTIAALASGNSFTGYTPKAYIMMVLLGLVSSLIGHTSINFVLRHLRSYIVSIMMLGEPAVATILAVIVVGSKEIPHWQEVAGSAVMLIGIYIAIKVSPDD
jgi:drug/metabolite transporter (DMT)-like permease